MNGNRQEIAIVGAGINGLIAANYLQRGGCQVTLLEQADHVGGACVSAVADIGGVRQPYALGPTVFGLMQDFVYHQTGLSERLRTYVPTHPDFIHFPGNDEGALIYSDPTELKNELANKWGEHGDLQAFRADEAQVIAFLQKGYREAIPPTLSDAIAALGKTLTDLWISGSAKALLDHYYTSERCKIFLAMYVIESGPVPLSNPYSAFTIPLIRSGSVFDGDYGFVEGGIWRVTQELGKLNTEVGVVTHLSSHVHEVDTRSGTIRYETQGQEHTIKYDQLILATDPMTAGKLVGSTTDIQRIENLQYHGTSGKLNLMFKNPVIWKQGTSAADSDAAYRYIFCVDSLDAFEEAALRVLDNKVAFEPGFLQVYCEGASMRQLDYKEPFERLTIYFKNLSLGEPGDALPHVEEQVKNWVLQYIKNPQDCVWSRILTPRDMQQLFHYPGGNIDHTMVTDGQTFFTRNHSDDPTTGFYNFGGLSNVYLCAASSYPMGSIAGTPGYMCSQQLLRVS